MSNKKLIRNLIFFLSFLIILSILLGNRTENAKADNTEVFIPEEDSRNNWQWNKTVEVGDVLMYELTYSKVNTTGDGDDDMIVKDNFLINISSIENETAWWGAPRYVSRINATQLYYNCSSMELIAYQEDPWQLVSFQYNSTLATELIILDNRMPIPFILPFNTTFSNDMDDLAYTINATSYWPMYIYGNEAMNKWDSITTDGDQRMMRFENTTHGYFAEFRFLDNGTLSFADMYYLQNQNNEFFNVTIKLDRIFDPSPLSETEWDFITGDTLYLGQNSIAPDKHEFNEIKLDIVDIKMVMNDTVAFRLYGDSDDPRWSCLSYVIVNASGWNSTTKKYDPISNGQEVPLLMANNHYPFISMDDNPFITHIPKNVEMSDLEFIIEIYKHYQVDYPFEISEIYQEKGFFVINQTDTDEGENYLAYFNVSSGKLGVQVYNAPNDNEYEILYQKQKYTITAPISKPLKSDIEPYLNWSVQISLNPAISPDFDAYSALLPVCPINSSTIEYDIYPSSGKFDVSLNNELSKYQVYMELYSNLTAPPTELYSTFTFSYDNALDVALGNRGYDERDLRPFFLRNYSSGPDDFDYRWVPIENEYFEVDENNNDIIISNPYIDSRMEYMYITIGLSTSADIQVGVEDGDVLYYGGFDDSSSTRGEVFEYKLEVTGIYAADVVLNMTELYQYAGLSFSTEGLGPEMQDILIVEGDLYKWENSTKSWNFEDLNIEICIANNYYPLLPAELGIIARTFLFPEGTVGSDFVTTSLSPYDGTPTIENEHIYYQSATYPGRYIDFHFNSTTGILTSFRGWIYQGGSDWDYVSQFQMYNESLASGENIIPLKNPLIANIKITANLTTIGGADLYYGLVDYNPVNESLVGTPLFCIDTLVHDASNLDNITLYIELDSTYDLSKMNIYLNAWIYESDDKKFVWENTLPSPLDWSDFITKNIAGNNITIVLPFYLNPGDLDVLIAVSYTLPSAPSGGGGGGGGGGGDKEDAIPGFDLYLLLGGIALLSVVSIIKRKKIIKI